MITTHLEFMQLAQPWMEEVSKIIKTDIEKLELISLNELAKKTNKLILTESTIYSSLSEKFVLGKNEITAIENCSEELEIHTQKIKLGFLKLGVGVKLSPTSYCEEYELKDRVVVMGCGHDEEHHPHKDQYCIDINSKIKPDVVIDISSSGQMYYLPDQSFSKVILEAIPLTPFLNGKSENIFGHINRILVKGGRLEFNNMFANDPETDFGCPFVIVNGNVVDGKIDYKQYNEHLSAKFEKFGFKFPENFKMEQEYKTYVLVKQ